MSDIQIGQKLYHFAYGPMTVTNITTKGRFIDTVADDPDGFNQPDYKMPLKQTWATVTVGHWLFETPEEVGNENNDFDFKSEWSTMNHAPLTPIEYAKDKNNWHSFYGKKGKKK